MRPAPLVDMNKFLTRVARRGAGVPGHWAWSADVVIGVLVVYSLAPPFAQMHNGLLLTKSYSGATRLSGRLSEELLLRCSHGDQARFLTMG